MSFFDTHEAGCIPADQPCIRCRLSNYLVNTQGIEGRDIVEAFLNGVGKPRDAAALGEHVGGLGLSKRALGPLNFRRIRTLADLVPFSERDLLAFPNLGRKGLNEIKTELAERDLHLGMDVERVLAMNRP